MPDTRMPLAGQHVHFNGLGGKGIAPAASLAHQAGMLVTGDDLAPNHRTRAFEAEGVAVTIGTNTIPDSTTMHVASAALQPGHDAGPQPMARLEFVQHLLAAHHKQLIAVSGSLGKSTAAALFHHILQPLVPSAYIGADVPGLLCGGKFAEGEWAIVEACEYKAAYLALAPEIVIALNLVQNHEDDLGPGTVGFERSLTTFLTQSPTPPRLAVLPDRVAALLAPHLATTSTHLQVETVGEGADWSVHVTDADAHSTTFRLAQHGTHAGTWTVPAPGPHLVTAASCGLIAALHLGVSPADSAEGLAGFKLPRRRMSTMYRDDRLVLIDDNARQPDQAAALIQALRQAHPDRHLVIAVAPWGRKNQRDLPAWALGLHEADTVWVLPVGEAAVPGGEVADADKRLAELIRLEGTPAYTVQPSGLLPLPEDRSADRVLVATAGYDASLAAFSTLHDQVITAFGTESTSTA
ncbi:Mur ligase domain-containing protein [Nocardiopsis metallicus]|uniref:UDP-N-acetylmuramate--alanine ligase n=1 Tax=Nocardiopsis metallicus TaxID=179819 RepID=A0A840WCU9_9ACTN|nr:Mur ligase domain-containing protein [Nocardiopsis metallicus]MBB5494829.1 UDP-N-acetylmuramate--alanine ligase [Nocardiopsis metallicus]